MATKESRLAIVRGNKGQFAKGNVLKYVKHGMYGTSEYIAWRNMLGRCLNSNNKNYKYYGAIGIWVCPRWLHSFENFYEDMGPKPIDGQRWSLDRIDNSGSYEPNNCRWATYNTQNKNRRPFSAEWRAKRAKAQTGEGNSFYGKKHSPATIKKMSEYRLEHYIGNEARG